METDSLTTELTPLFSGTNARLLDLSQMGHPKAPAPHGRLYFVSLCGVCFRQRLQNFWNSSRPVVVFLFFVVE